MPDKTIYHFMKPLNARMAVNYKRGFGPRRMVLLLTITGRRSGLPRTTPLQFEEVDGDIYIGSARGKQADWFKNIRANPMVHVQLGKCEFDAVAEPATDPRRFARADLEKFCQEKATAILRPIREQDTNQRI